MPKKIAKKDLPSTDSVAAAKPLLETIEKRNAAVASPPARRPPRTAPS